MKQLRERAEKQKADQASMQRKEIAPPLAQFDQAALDTADTQQRGYLLQDSSLNMVALPSSLRSLKDHEQVLTQDGASIRRN
jgi:hypothetical protein